MSERNKFLLAMLVALLIFSLGAGLGYGSYWYFDRNNPTGEEADDFGIYWEAWHIVEDQFYGDIPQGSEPVYGAVRGALDTLQDPYTTFIEPQPRALEKAELEGQFGGIGAFIRRGESGEVILEPMVDSPAEQAGVLKDDVVLKVDDTPMTPEMATDEVVLLIRGEVGTQVKLTLERADSDDPIEVSVTRQIIETPSVDWRVLNEDPSIGYIHIRLFTERTGRELERAIKELEDAGVTSLVVDLRDNGGGLLEASVDVVSQFVDKGVVLYENRRDQQEKAYKVRNGEKATDLPLTVLVNGGTASASEIVAGALRDNDRGPLIGERTYGKGSVQLVYDLSDESSLHVTVARWLTPNQNEIDGQGLTPDIEVTPEPDSIAEYSDIQLDRAIDYLREQAQERAE